jgi:NAD(P)-dependent dehydrogenase (short-subunit alcohol dehydrogenase family)
LLADADRILLLLGSVTERRSKTNEVGFDRLHGKTFIRIETSAKAAIAKCVLAPAPHLHKINNNETRKQATNNLHTIMTSLVNKNIIITGATSGLGVDMAAAFSREGANVFIGGRRSDLGQKVALQTKSTFHVVDVADEESNRAFFQAAADHFGANAAGEGKHVVDYIFLNAGVEGNGSEMVVGTDAFNVSAYDFVFGVNVRGIVLGLQFGTQWLRSGGSFVFTSSGGSILPMPTVPFYAASKATVDALARSFAAQLAQSSDDHLKSLSIVTINPMVYETEMSDRMTGGNDEMLQYFASLLNPSKRVGKGFELAALVVDYARGAMTYQSGDSFVLDADTHFPLAEYFDRMKAVVAAATTATKVEL